MYAYGSNKSIAGILNKKEVNNKDYLVSFFSKTLHDHEEKYSFIEKQVYVIIKIFSKLKHCFSQSKVLVLKIHLDVRNYIL